jgi:hypothetical protein
VDQQPFPGADHPAPGLQASTSFVPTLARCGRSNVDSRRGSALTAAVGKDPAPGKPHTVETVKHHLKPFRQRSAEPSHDEATAEELLSRQVVRGILPREARSGPRACRML